MNIITFFVTAIGLGFGLAMDAVSVSLADIVREPGMTKGKKASIALAFGVFQFAMPLIGWVLVSEAVKMMVHICESTEPFYEYRIPEFKKLEGRHSVSSAVGVGAVRTAANVDAKALVIPTMSGFSGRVTLA